MESKKPCEFHHRPFDSASPTSCVTESRLCSSDLRQDCSWPITPPPEFPQSTRQRPFLRLVVSARQPDSWPELATLSHAPPTICPIRNRVGRCDGPGMLIDGSSQPACPTLDSKHTRANGWTIWRADPCPFPREGAAQTNLALISPANFSNSGIATPAALARRRGSPQIASSSMGRPSRKSTSVEGR